MDDLATRRAQRGHGPVVAGEVLNAATALLTGVVASSLLPGERSGSRPEARIRQNHQPV